MSLDIPQLSVFPSAPNCLVNYLSRVNLFGKLHRLAVQLGRNNQITQVFSADLQRTIKKQRYKSIVIKLHVAVAVVDDDAKRTVLNKGIQENGPSFQITAHTFPLEHPRPKDQSLTA